MAASRGLSLADWEPWARARSARAPLCWPCWAGLFSPKFPSLCPRVGARCWVLVTQARGGQGSSAVGRGLLEAQPPPPSLRTSLQGVACAERVLLVRELSLKAGLFLSSFAVLRSSLFRTSLGHCRASGGVGAATHDHLGV